MSNNCNSPEYIDGGTHTNTTIINPEVVNGKLTNVTIESSTLTGNVTLDEATAVSLTQQLCQYFESCVNDYIDDKVEIQTPANVASVFNTCAGSPHTPGARIPLCDEMNAAVAAVADEAAAQLERAVEVLTSEYQAADTNISSTLTAALAAQGAEITAAYTAADTQLNDRISNLRYDRITGVTMEEAGEIRLTFIDDAGDTKTFDLPVRNAVRDAHQITSFQVVYDTTGYATGIELSGSDRDGVVQTWVVSLNDFGFLRIPTVNDTPTVTNGPELPTQIVTYDVNRPTLQGGCDGYLYLEQLNVYVPYYYQV